MIYFYMFASTYLSVFLLGYQQQNVIGRHYVAAFVTSFGIGLAQIFLWRHAPTAAYDELFFALIGGPLGIISAMYLHPKVHTRKIKPGEASAVTEST